MRFSLILAIGVLGETLPAAENDKAAIKLIEVNKIWDKGKHNAFTDLIRFQDKWFCTFREGDGHAAGAGKVRVLVSPDGKNWESSALIARKDVDLRDPKLSITPEGRLMIVGGAAEPASRNPVRDHYSFICFSKDGKTWTEPKRVLGSWQWLWRVTWHNGTAFGVAYSWDPQVPRGKRNRGAKLYRSKDGLNYEEVTTFQLVNPSEATLAFDRETMLCLQRRDGNPNSAQIGISKPPYKEWHWKDLGQYFGGPNMVRAKNGSWLAAGRLLTKNGARTALCRLDPHKGTLKPLITLPSGGDTSYPGLVVHGSELWMSYYSSHEGKTSIYLARFSLP
ncbi:MAG: hypothetical protein KatS3mg105_1105 [Gemmatales bacterium]|nr:MAG: hypothetical protein KatS3mg105_1105 [Gemmatales bacterium]